MLTEYKTTLSPELLRLKSRPLRDLAWCLLYSTLFTPISQLPAEWFNDDFIDDTDTKYLLLWLQKIDKDPSTLNKHLAEQRSIRLGIYFEQLMSFYFEHFEVNDERRFCLVAKNHQVNENKRTLGEFDFIIFDQKTKNIKHVEVAVKFYLGHQDYNKSSRKPIKNNRPLHNWHNWVGPNFRDTLAIKMRHLQEHQLLLGQSIAGQQSLVDLMIDKGYKNIRIKNISCRLHISGRFFTPFLSNIKPPTYSSQSNLTDFWLYRTEFIKCIKKEEWNNALNKTEKSKNFQYCLLPKQYWLSELTLKDIELGELQLLSGESIIKFLATEQLENEWHFAIIDSHKTEDQKNDNATILSIESGRFFIIN
jgi:hypothetical protein